MPRKGRYATPNITCPMCHKLMGPHYIKEWPLWKLCVNMDCRWVTCPACAVHGALKDDGGYRIVLAGKFRLA